ncbi:MAG TPA: response regulator [Candidatus Limnocylindria bacterium]|nr:response regulator [Candidatus Limnocylindria bacterium]
MRVLVVEDEEDLGSIFRDFLIELGHQAMVVRSAEAALGTLAAERPDAIILDIHLPGMSGLDFLQLRPVREAGLPIVAVSGVVTESQARECLRLGALDFVGKPVALERLSEVLMFLEPHALTRRHDSGPGARERRRSARAAVGFPVRIVEYRGTAWDGECVEMSVTGMRARTGATLMQGAAVKVHFTPDDAAPIEVICLVARLDSDGVGLSFVHLPDGDAERIRALVARLSSR